jgi:outer membrane protein assembly factor BamB
LLWQVDELGGGFSSISIAGGRIFTMGEVRKPEQGAYLIALNLADGELVWKTRVGQGRPNTTPTVDGNRVYSLDRGGHLVCASTSTGEILWEKDYAVDFGGKMMSGWGYSESPLIDGDHLICTPGSESAAIAALDKVTGEVVWQTSVSDLGNRGQDGAGYSSVVVSNAGGVKQYVQMMGRGLISVDASSGKLLWSYNRVANGTANIPTPIVRGDHVFCSTGYGTGAALLKVQAGAHAVEEVYFLNSKKLQNHHGGMILLGDYLYCGHGHGSGLPICIDFASGKAAWGPTRGAGDGSAAIVYADGHLYFRYENGKIALVEATPDEYRLKGEFKMASSNGKSWPHPVILAGKLYLRDQRSLLCYDIHK